MGLGLGTRLGEYKAPEVACGTIRRPWLSTPDGQISDNYNKHMGWSIDMDGTAEYANKSPYIIPDFMTVSVQFKADAISSHRCIFSVKDTSQTKVCTIYLQNSKLYAVCTSDDWSSVKVGQKTATLSGGTWYHVVATFDTGASAAVGLVVNGLKYIGGLDTTNAVYSSGLSVARATSDESGTITYTYFNGKVAQMAVWQGILTDWQINGLYFDGKPRSPLCVSRGGPDRWLTASSGDGLRFFWPIVKNDTLNLHNYSKHNFSGATSLWRGGLIDDGTNGGDTVAGYGLRELYNENADVAYENMIQYSW